MSALYIKGHNNDDDLSAMLRDAYKNVDEVTNVIDGIGHLKAGSYKCVFLSDCPADIHINKAYQMLSKLVGKDAIQVISKKTKPINFKGNWIEVPNIMMNVSEYFSGNSPFDFEKNIEKKIDLEQLIELSNGDESFVKDILSMFVVDYPSYIKGFSIALESEDIEALGSIAHKIKAPLKLFGINELDKHIDYLDELGLENPDSPDWGEVKIALCVIMSCLPVVLSEVEEELQVFS